jgi:hypothetical protein
MLDTVIAWAKARFAKEHRYMMRLWRASWKASRSLTGAAVAVICIAGLVIGFIFGKWAGTTNIYNNIAVPAPSAPASQTKAEISNRWEPLSTQEIISLRERWRGFEPVHLGVLCAIPACADLAQSIFDVANDFSWPAVYSANYFSDGIHPGIEIYSWKQNTTLRDKLANALEVATNGRLKLLSREWSGDPPVTNPPMSDNINIVIGRLK